MKQDRSVSEKYTTKTEFGNLRIGGANLLKTTKLLTNKSGSSDWKVTDTGSEGFKKLQVETSDTTSWIECQIPLYTTINSLTSKVTISFEYYENTAGLLSFSLGAYNGNTRVYEISNIVVSSSFKTISRNGDWKYVSYTFDPTSINGKANATQYKVQFKKTNGKTGTIYVRKPMLEVGTKPSSWSPAPQDVQSQIDTHTTQISTTTNKVSSIETNLSGITSRVTNVENKTTTIEGKVNSHESRLNTAESKIIIITKGTTEYRTSKKGTMLLNGNAKTAHIGINRVPLRAKVYIGVGKIPKRAVVWIGHNDKPTRCI